MRVAMFSQYFDPEGQAASVPGTIARALRDRGHDVHVVTGFPNYPSGRVFAGYRVRPYQREVLDGVTVHRSAMYASHDTGAVRRAANYLSFAGSGAINGVIRLPRMDVAFVYSMPATTAIPAMVLRALRGVPYVVQIQDMWPQTVTSSGFLSEASTRRAERVLHRFCDAAYRSASSMAVTSPGMRQLVEDRGIDPRKLEFVPNWADEKHFTPATVTRDLLKELGPFRSFTAMYAGNFGEMQRCTT
jgi:colanic acid biosynthesis glycosyl transferase WcaI